MSDNVRSPKHYKLDGLDIESIDIIRAVLGDGFKDFCRGNVIKYVLRANKKNGVEDLKKANVYLNWEIEEWLDKVENEPLKARPEQFFVKVGAEYVTEGGTSEDWSKAKLFKIEEAKTEAKKRGGITVPFHNVD